MGYMGFGMRKENYKRKPKKPFERILKFQKLTSNTENNPEYNASKEFQHLRFKAIYQRRWFKITACVILITCTSFLIWLNIILPYRYEKQKNEFEAHGILEYYQKSNFDKVGLFLISRRDRLDRIDDPFVGNGVNFWIKSTDYKEDAFFGRTYVGHKEAEKVIINSGSLNIISDKGVESYSLDWRTFIRVNNIRDIDPSIMEYLQTDSNELDQILRLVFSRHLYLENTDTSSSISFNHYYGQYSIRYLNALDSTQSIINEIMPGVYLTKRN
jgi:hypothetical protein